MADVQGGADADVKARIGKARQAFTSLKPIQGSKKISFKTKLKLYNSNVKKVPLYGSETWKTTREIVRKLRVFTHKCLRIILHGHKMATESDQLGRAQDL